MLDPWVMPLLIATTAAASIMSTVFILAYSRFTWEETVVGRLLMTMSIAISLRAWLGLVTRWDEVHPEIDLRTYSLPTLSLSWIVIAIVFARCAYVLIRGQRGRRHNYPESRSNDESRRADSRHADGQPSAR